MMQTLFVIVRKYDANGVRYNDRMYWASYEWIGDITQCSKYTDLKWAESALKDIADKGAIFQIEKIYVNI